MSSELFINGSCGNMLSVFNKRKNYVINISETAHSVALFPIFNGWESDPHIVNSHLTILLFTMQSNEKDNFYSTIQSSNDLSIVLSIHDFFLHYS